MGTTYTELGARLGVDVCTGCDLQFAAGGDHRLGFWGLDGRFHWSERAMRKTSIRNFIWRIAAQRHNDPEGPAWRRYWHRISWAKAALRVLHIKLPAIAWDEQRATLRALLAPRDFFVGGFPEGDEITRKEAARWARRPIVGANPVEYDS